MKNASRTISPGEIKKYIYCPYGWYYDRLYGRKRIYELYRKHNAKLGLKDAIKSGYVRGQRFHGGYRLFSPARLIIKYTSVIVIFLACIYFLCR